MTTPAPQLAPSEVLFIHGGTVASTPADGYRIPGGVLIDPTVLAPALLQVALLANERAGAITVEAGVHRSLFGLRKTPEIRLRSAGGAASWPAGTLEAEVLAILRRTRDSARVTPRSMVAAIIPAEWSPHVEIIRFVEKGLYGRGIADVRSEEATAPNGFRWTRNWAELNEAGRALSPPDAAGPLGLLEGMRSGRPEVWPLFERQVIDGLAARTKEQEYHFPNAD